jgi:hypothetical protein
MPPEFTLCGDRPVKHITGLRGGIQHTVKLHVRPRWILIVASAPLVLLGLVGLVTEAGSLVRYDAAYFEPAYLEQYGEPGAVAKALEVALQTGDEQLLAELQALKAPARFEPSPNIEFVMLWEYTDRYMTYLYFDPQSYQRYPYYFEKVRGRWVVAPCDIYYYMHSGRWQELFVPVAAAWWVLGSATIAAVWLIRASPRMRALLYGDWIVE